MIFLEMSGRAGNQMFRYAFARWLQVQGGMQDMELVIDFSPVLQEKKGEEMPGWEDSLAHFYTIPYRYYEKPGRIWKNETTLTEKAVLSFIRLVDHFLGDRPLKRISWRRHFLPWQNRHGIYQMFVGYDHPYKWAEKKRKLVSGPFECARYCEEIKDILWKEFVPRYPVADKNLELMKRIQETDSVCISVRRGNYLKYPALDVCSKEYFERAALKMQELVQDPVFFVFSDDISWTKENLKLPGEVFYEDGNDPVWEKLRLMYSCRHFIIANSTFSWWVQFLGKDPGKKVIAPDHWYNGEYQPPLYEEGWILSET
ncbi:MAG: alpha-1,2-fucosyltransferase [Parasporobacterium sp.]|nr:alpha-1,2-fucosyltransferase [Parasporobacterium sp.]